MSTEISNRNSAEQFVNDNFDKADIHRGLNYIHVDFHIDPEVNDPIVEAMFFISENEMGGEEVCPNGMVNTIFGDSKMMAEGSLVNAMEDEL
jgi:hypothetical protein